MGVYLVVQMVESYVLAPPRRPFRDLGVILAAPLMAVLRVFILRLWVEDALGDREGAKAALVHAEAGAS